MRKVEDWASIAIGAFLGAFIADFALDLLGFCAIPPFTGAWAAKFLLAWAASTLFCGVVVIWLPDKIRDKKAMRF